MAELDNLDDYALISFANAMRIVMERQAKLGKSGWENMRLSEVLTRLIEEIEELKLAVDKNDWFNIRGEAVDVANFAMMVFINAGFQALSRTETFSEAPPKE